MSVSEIIDILENAIDADVLSVLLADHASGKNIIWATDDYAENGEGYDFHSEITPQKITGEHGTIIKPRTEKDKKEQLRRVRDKAEVFTPSWVCNAQNNLVDNAWFGKTMNHFNKELPNGWKSTYPRKKQGDNHGRVNFPNKPGKTWEDYVKATRMEISCGEAPYLTSRYDTVTGEYIRVKRRIGLLDRKLRVITENTETWQAWLKWAKIALQNTYGFDWQGDNVLLARENLLYTVIEHYHDVYARGIPKKTLLQFAEIISWNVIQMDGLKYVIPESCIPLKDTEITLFGEITTYEPCPGCEKKDRYRHTGIYAVTMDWTENETIRFVDLMKGDKKE